MYSCISHPTLSLSLIIHPSPLDTALAMPIDALQLIFHPTLPYSTSTPSQVFHTTAFPETTLKIPPWPRYISTYIKSSNMLTLQRIPHARLSPGIL
jgi:hypothetical protein